MPYGVIGWVTRVPALSSGMPPPRRARRAPPAPPRARAPPSVQRLPVAGATASVGMKSPQPKDPAQLLPAGRVAGPFQRLLVLVQEEPALIRRQVIQDLLRVERIVALGRLGAHDVIVTFREWRRRLGVRAQTGYGSVPGGASLPVLGKSGWPVRAALLKMAASSAAWVPWPSRWVWTGGNTDRIPFSSPARGGAGWRLVTHSAWLETRAKMARTLSRHSAARCWRR